MRDLEDVERENELRDQNYMDAAAVPVPDTGDDTLRERLAWAMRGTVDGDLIDPDSEIPIGEAERLAYEFIREHTAGLALGMQSWRERAVEAEAKLHCARDTTHFEWGIRNHDGHVGLYASELSAREAYEQRRDHVFPPQGLIRRTVTTLYSEWEATP